MQRKWSALVSGVMGAITVSTVAAEPTCLGKTPLEAAKRFYENHSDFYYENPKQYADVLTPAFAKALQRNYDCAKKEGICALEADPWIDAQDGMVTEPQFKLQESALELKATVSMDYLFKMDEKEKGSQQSVQLELIRKDANSCWMVNEFKDPSGAPITQTIKNGLE